MDSQLAGRSEAFVNSVRGWKAATVAGAVLVPLGAWAALEPFLFGGWDWNMDNGRYLLTVVPGAAAMLGGLVMLSGRKRAATVGGGIALAGGLWFIVAPLVYSVFAGTELGTLAGGESIRMLQWMPFFFGAGALISLVSAYGLGLMAPLEFSDEAEPEKRVRVPLPPERARRQRGVKEPATRTRAKRSSE
jgi:hypothetical protein